MQHVRGALERQQPHVCYVESTADVVNTLQCCDQVKVKTEKLNHIDAYQTNVHRT